jgi:hypothetical protein
VERIDAIRLGSAFLKDAEALTTDIRVWARSQSKDRITEIVRGPDRRQVDEDLFVLLGLG